MLAAGRMEALSLRWGVTVGVHAAGVTSSCLFGHVQCMRYFREQRAATVQCAAGPTGLVLWEGLLGGPVYKRAGQCVEQGSP